MRPTLWLAPAFLAFGFAALADEGARRGEASAPARIYGWIDENGVAHYTTELERVPEELRDQPLRSESVSASAPAAVDAWLQQERIAETPQPDAASATAGDTSDPLSVLDARIAELERAIAADEELLKGELVDTGEAPSNETLKQVAERMPARIAELQKLEAERDALRKASGE